MSNNVLEGKYLICGTTGTQIRETKTIVTWQFVDYSWPCNQCNEIHCSTCFYDNDPKDSTKIIVTGCGKFMQNNKIETIIAQPEGTEYHLKSASKSCPNRNIGMVNSDYIEIEFEEVNKRKLTPCICNFANRGSKINGN